MAILALGAVVRTNSAALLALIEMGRLRVSVVAPVLLMVKVCVIFEPTMTARKSVLSAVEGVVSPSVMDVDLPCTLVSANFVVH